ncbi:Glycosyltransferase involved in cell wall bisynthesis [Chryseobacterium piscicola]|jgi:glycosyltransferase involved in cell wall biosynthesis|uniref:Glycosyltransferase involved in cell wall bisynthesis n=1 Tax=Chryseobacterium piscicola TaxID=551459 RepID=A0A1N7NBY6_9FLAO|nr:glycosyltransferase family 4 protein [Chryseobacterium piscicola]PQA92194.1 hypothetical protein B0A70_11255 [Chryseobacterium piscicola]SIS95903.1 Glycosyltransferase involved in cell wall bisynthesis [Chryseobacterium piscicola]
MSSIKKLLIVTKEYKCSQNLKVGGTGVFYKNLCEEFAKNGISPHVFLISKKKFDLIENGVTIHSIKDIFKGNPFLEIIRSLTGKIAFLENLHFKIYLFEKKLIKNKIQNYINKNHHDFDIAETHDFDGLALSIPENLTSVIRCHGSWSVLERYFGYKKVHKGRIFCEQVAMQKAKNVIAISEYNRRINKELFGINDAELIYNGIDENFYKPILNSEIIPQSIFYFGNVSYEKGADTIIEHFVKIKKKYPKSTLHFVGNPNGYEKHIPQIISELYVRNSIVFHGSKNNHEMVELLSKADVVCFPSKGENFSLSLLEVMALQKPVICSEIDSFTEIIKDSENGMIAYGDNFYKKIDLLFESFALKNTIATNARETVKQNFTINKLIAKTLYYYKKIK